MAVANLPAGQPDELHRREGKAPDQHMSQDDALLGLLRLLEQKRYAFVTPTPATHARVIGRVASRQARSLRDVLGWSLPFESGQIDADVEELLGRAGMLSRDGDAMRSKVRVSSLHDRLFLHSAFPTNDNDAVFFGPDSYRFADLVRAELTRCPERAGAQIVDIGAGSGVGAIIASLACPLAHVRMTDINPLALRFARINAKAAGVDAETFACDTLEAIDGEFDIVTANPPYIIDPGSRLYRDGGGMHGGQVSVDMTRMALDRLAPGGRMILYTGSAIVDGADELKRALAWEASAREFDLGYRELDPDVFGEELEQPAYRDVERIALVAAVITRPA
jgi:hypothetical protein